MKPVIESETWKKRFKEIGDLLVNVWFFAYRYRVEFDTEYQGQECKLVVYQEEDGKVCMVLTKEEYEKALELSESEDEEVREAARLFLIYVELFSESFEVKKVRDIMYWATWFGERLKNGKIRTSTIIRSEVYEVDEERVKELAQIDEDIQRYYEEFQRKVEREAMKIEKERKRRLRERITVGGIYAVGFALSFLPVGIMKLVNKHHPFAAFLYYFFAVVFLILFSIRFLDFFIDDVEE